MKIMVSGIGGVGGYIAAVLCACYPGQVTLVARKARKEQLAKGLVVHSALLGEQTYHPAVTDTPAAAGIQDVIFLCVKNYSLAEALCALLPCIGNSTIVVPVMNGLDHAERARALMPKGQVVNSVIYITSAYDSDFSIRHTSPYARLYVDSADPAAARAVCRLLHHDGIMECTVPADMAWELWKKFIVNCAYNTITAFYACTTQGILAYPERREEFFALLSESCAVAAACGIAVAPSLAREIYDDMLYRRRADATSSMARDVLSGKKTEYETFSGTLTALAKRHNVPVPVTERFHAALKEREVIP